MLRGRAFRFGDNVSTDDIQPGRFSYLRSNIPELARHLFEDLSPSFASQVEPGDFIAAGQNFGLGSSREHAPLIIKTAGISAVLARSVARIFYRNAINVGLPVLICDTDRINDHDRLEIDLGEGRVRNLTTGDTLTFGRIPQVMLRILEEGGLVPYIKKHGDFVVESKG